MHEKFGLGCMLAYAVFAILFTIALYVLIAYVGIHFIHKFW